MGAAFLSTIIPGVLLAILYCVLNIWFVKDNPNIEVSAPLPFKQAAQQVASSGYKALFAAADAVDYSRCYL